LSRLLFGSLELFALFSVPHRSFSFTLYHMASELLYTQLAEQRIFRRSCLNLGRNAVQFSVEGQPD
jgi:hypothetical protein